MPTITPQRPRSGAIAAISPPCSPACSALRTKPPSPPATYPALSSKVEMTPGIMKSSWSPETITRTQREPRRGGPCRTRTDMASALPGTCTSTAPASTMPKRIWVCSSPSPNDTSHPISWEPSCPGLSGPPLAKWGPYC